MTGIVEPIKAGIRDPKLGVGKQEQDDFFTSEENVQRKKLGVEVEETEEHAKKREVSLWLLSFMFTNLSSKMVFGVCMIFETYIAEACMFAFSRE